MSLPEPEPGLVISYSYLWYDEAQEGADEGRKDRPCVVVVAVERGESGIMVTVAPVTHNPPADPAAAVEIPAVVKRHLDLDDARSWVIVSEGNTFEWPGVDLRRVPGKGTWSYGMLPPRFFGGVRDRFVAWRRKRLDQLVQR
jgi:PemK-like, MazF-like toxin of type II toxin-antitoxin system